MQPITVANFKGCIPRVAPKLLPDNFAQDATNCDMRTGQLAPIKGMSQTRDAPIDIETRVTVPSPSGLSTIFKNAGSWMTWNIDVDIVKAQVSDSNGRLYLTSRDVSDAPHETDLALFSGGYGLAYRGLGVPAPVSTLAISTKGDPAYGTTTVGTITGATTAAGSDMIMTPTAHGLTLEVDDYITITNSSVEADEMTYILVSFHDDVNGFLQINANLKGTSSNVSVSITRQKDAGVQATVSYVYTKVRTWPDGSTEESAPSDPSNIDDILNGQGVTLSGFDAWAGDGGGYLTQTFRIYRLVSGVTGGEFLYLDEIPYTQTTYEDYAGNDDDGYQLLEAGNDILETSGWLPPPTALEGLTQYSNGIVVGFVGNKLYVSEPYAAYAWPEKYTMSFDYNIVALATHDECLIVLTEAYLYVVTGLDPQSLSQTILPFEQACVSKRGVVETDVGVLYPSPDGLFLISGHTCRSVTENVFTREQWQALNPETLISFFYNDMYYGFFAGTGLGIVFNFKKDPYIVNISIPGMDINGGFLHAESDALYIASGDNIYTWGAGSDLTYSWKSKVFRSGDAHNYSCGAVVADGNVTFRTYANHALSLELLADAEEPVITEKTMTYDGTIGGDEMFRLPGGYRAREFEFELEADCTVESVSIGTHPGELL